MQFFLSLLILISHAFAADLGVKGGWARPKGRYGRYAYGVDGDLDILKDWKLGFYYLTSTHSGESVSRLNHFGFQIETRLAPLVGEEFKHFHLGTRIGASDIFVEPSASGPGHYYSDFSLGLQLRASWTVFRDYDVGGEAAYIFNIGKSGVPTLYALANLRYVF